MQKRICYVLIVLLLCACKVNYRTSDEELKGTLTGVGYQDLHIGIKILVYPHEVNETRMFVSTISGNFNLTNVNELFENLVFVTQSFNFVLMSDMLITKKKPTYPINPFLGDYLELYSRAYQIPVFYDDLLRFSVEKWCSRVLNFSFLFAMARFLR